MRRVRGKHSDWIDADRLAVALELQQRPCAVVELHTQALMLETIASMFGPPVGREVARRSGGREGLDARPDRRGDQVLFEPLVMQGSAL